MIKLFEKDSYLSEFKTKIKRINKDSNQIELEETAFYGKSGGQPGDSGVLSCDNTDIEIINTIKFENTILHETNDIKNIHEGLEIKGKINWEERYKYMRMHTTLHLLCAVIPLGVTGGQIGLEKSRLDFNLKDEKLDKEEIEKKMNEFVNQEIDVDYEWVSNEVLEKKPELVRTMSVKPPKVEGKIRLVKIGSIDLQPCGGTHVKNTREIGHIKIGKIENKGKMNRRVNLKLDT